MWYAAAPILDAREIESFESVFRFAFPPGFREFLSQKNGAKASDVVLITAAGPRHVTRILDFRQARASRSADSAWAVNRRLRSTLSARRVVFARSNHHLVCLERVQKTRRIVIWNYITQSFEPVLVPWEAFLEEYA